jgi:hypothetical protein
MNACRGAPVCAPNMKKEKGRHTGRPLHLSNDLQGGLETHSYITFETPGILRTTIATT